MSETESLHGTSRRLLWKFEKYAILFSTDAPSPSGKAGDFDSPIAGSTPAGATAQKTCTKAEIQQIVQVFLCAKTGMGDGIGTVPLEKHLAGVAFSCISQGESPCRYHRRVAATKLTTSNAPLVQYIMPDSFCT